MTAPSYSIHTPCVWNEPADVLFVLSRLTVWPNTTKIMGQVNDPSLYWDMPSGDE